MFARQFTLTLPSVPPDLVFVLESRTVEFGRPSHKAAL